MQVDVFTRDELPDVYQEFTPLQAAFLEALPEAGSVSGACRALGISRANAVNWSKDNPRFVSALEQAKEEAGDLVLSSLHRVALSASDQMPATVSRIFLVKGYKPEFRDQVQVNHSGAVLNAHVTLDTMPQQDRVALLQLALEAQARRNVALPSPSEE